MKKMKNRIRCCCCQKWLNVDGDLFLLEYDEQGEYPACEKCSSKWSALVPTEVISRLQDIGDEITLRGIINETKYLRTVVADGGSWYNDDPFEEKKILVQCDKLLSAFGSIIKQAEACGV